MNAVRRESATGHGSALVAVLSLILLAGCGSAPSATDRTSPGQEPGATGVISAADVARAVEDLASMGIETRVRPSDAASIAPVAGDASIVRLLQFQVRNLVLEEAAGGGIRGADLDALSAAGGGGPVSRLVAGWATSGPTPTASWAASLIGPSQPADAAASSFPTLALVAFVADATNGSGPAAADAPRWAPARLALAGTAQEAPIRLAVASDSDFCAEVSAYLSSTLGDIIDADADPPVWLRQLIDIYAPQYASDPDLLRRTIGALALMAYATSMAQPWTVSVVADPSAVAYGIEGQDAVQGDVVLTVASGGDALADDVAECADLADAQVTSVPIAGSSVTWDSSGLGVHASEVSETTTLDDIGSASLTYQTATESQETADQGDPVTAQVGVNVWVDRAEITALAAVVKSILLGEAAGSPAGPTATALYEAMESALDVVMRPSGFALIDVTYHTAKASPSPGPSGPPATDVTGTWEGIWQNDPEWGGAAGGFTMIVAQEGNNSAARSRCRAQRACAMGRLPALSTAITSRWAGWPQASVTWRSRGHSPQMPWPAPGRRSPATSMYRSPAAGPPPNRGSWAQGRIVGRRWLKCAQRRNAPLRWHREEVAHHACPACSGSPTTQGNARLDHNPGHRPGNRHGRVRQSRSQSDRSNGRTLTECWG